GQDEIEAVHESLQHTCRVLGSKIRELIICSIYANLPPDMQAKFFEPTPHVARKSKNKNGIIVSFSSSVQELQQFRAGRVEPGHCFRLYTQHALHAFHNELKENTVPEIQITNLANVVLSLKHNLCYLSQLCQQGFHVLVSHTKKQNMEYIRQVMEINPEWLTEAVPYYYSKSELDNFD
ncbi:14772_t:CDS:2, partial [Cetraspora pellucida]